MNGIVLSMSFLLLTALIKPLNAQISLNSGGEFGIGGISSPSRALHIKSDNHSSTELFIERRTYSGHNTVVFIPHTGIVGDSNYPLWSLGMYSNNKRFDIWNYPGGRRLTIKNNGNVGIGYTNPQYRLHVNGEIHGTVLSSSDERFKKNIKSISNGGDILNKLNAVKYQRKDYSIPAPQESLSSDTSSTAPAEIQLSKEDNRLHYGFLAQDLKEVMPDLVYEDSLGYFSINYIGLIPVLVEALKEQDKYRKQLEQRIEKMEKGSIVKSSIVPSSDSFLEQNAPNPFNEDTEIKYHVGDDHSDIHLNVYELNGRQILSKSIYDTGEGSIVIHASELYPGMFIYNLMANGQILDSKQMILTQVVA